MVTDQVEHFQSVDEAVDFPHEAFHEDDLAQANAHVPDFSGKSLSNHQFLDHEIFSKHFNFLLKEYLKLVEVVQLHSSTKIEQHVSQVGTFAAQFVQHRVRDQFNRQLDVAKRRPESNTASKKSPTSMKK